MSSAFLPPAAFTAKEPRRNGTSRGLWCRHGRDLGVNWDELGAWARKRKAGASALRGQRERAAATVGANLSRGQMA